jgi:hypothetical protein
MGVNPKYLTTAKPGGIVSEISPFENCHDLVPPEWPLSTSMMPTLSDTAKRWELNISSD